MQTFYQIINFLLMGIWEKQQQLDDLVEAELQATVARAKTLSETIGT